MTERYLLLGSTGMLGQAFHKLLTNLGHIVITPKIDIADRKQVISVLEREYNAIINDRKYDAVINCAAYTKVDQAEMDEPDAYRVNVMGAMNLAFECMIANVPLIHFSSDYVFSGNSKIPYRVDDKRDPCNAYGRTKNYGEDIVRQTMTDHLIIRTSWLYASWGDNFVKTILDKAQNNKEIKVVDDQFGSPSSAEKVAQITYDLFKKDARGTFHVTSGVTSPATSWYDFANQIIRLSKFDCLVTPCKTSDMQRYARRPRYSVLDISKTETYVGREICGWRDDLVQVINQILYGEQR